MGQGREQGEDLGCEVHARSVQLRRRYVSPAARARSTAGPMAFATASVSASVEV